MESVNRNQKCEKVISTGADVDPMVEEFYEFIQKSQANSGGLDKRVQLGEGESRNNSNNNSSKAPVKVEIADEGTGSIGSASIVTSRELSIQKKSCTLTSQAKDSSNISAFNFDLEGKRHNLDFESEISKLSRDCRLISPVANTTDNSERGHCQIKSNDNVDKPKLFKIPHPYDPMGMNRRSSDRQIIGFPVLAQFAFRPPILGGQPSMKNTGIKMILNFLDMRSRCQDKFFQGSARAKTAYSLAKRMDLEGALKVANSTTTGLADNIVSRTSTIMQEGLATVKLQADNMMGTRRYDLCSYDHTARSIALAQMIQLKKGCTLSLGIHASGPDNAIGTDSILRFVDHQEDIDTAKYDLAGDRYIFAKIGTVYLPVILTDSTGEPDMDRVRQLICAYSDAHFEVCLDKNVYTTNYQENIKTAEGYHLYPKELMDGKDWLVPLYAEGIMTKAAYQNLEAKNGYIAVSVLPARSYEIKGKQYYVNVYKKNNDPGNNNPGDKPPVVAQPVSETKTVAKRHEAPSSSHQQPNFIQTSAQPAIPQMKQEDEKDYNTLEDLITELISSNELDHRRFADATFPSQTQVRNCHDRLRKAEKANQIPARMPTKAKRWCWHKGTEVKEIKKVIKRHFGSKNN